MADVQKIIINNTEYDVDDPNDVEKENGELCDTVINYDKAETSAISSFTSFLDKFVSGTKVGQWFKNFRAGCEFLLHIGSLVNNCVSDNEALPLAAAQGKVLMDLITEQEQTIEDQKQEITDLNNSIGAKARTSTGSTLISSADDLDTFIGSDYAGIYHFASSSLPTNKPSDYTSMNGYLEVVYLGQSINTTVQYIYRFSGGISNCWTRRYYNGAWSDWEDKITEINNDLSDKVNYIYADNFDDFVSKLSSMQRSTTCPIYLGTSATNTLLNLNGSYSAKGFVGRQDTVGDGFVIRANQGIIYTFRITISSGEINYRHIYTGTSDL